MNHILATYIDFVQSVGFVFLLASTLFVVGKLFGENKKDNFIKAVKIKVFK